MADLLTTTPRAAALPATRWANFRRSTGFAPLAIGAFAFVFLGLFSWVPSPWYDEAATISATHRTLPELFALLQSVDAVHGAYYLLMHGWFDLVGYSPLTLRLPSTVATAVAAGLLVVLVRRLAGRHAAGERTAVVSGLVFCLLPRVTWMATEGRSYAISALLAVALTLLFHVAQSWGERDRRQRILIWTAYGALAALSSAVFIYLALLVLAHGVSAVLLAALNADRGTARVASRRTASRRTASRRAVLGWFLAAAAAGLALVPLALEIVAQSGQVHWIKPLGVGALLTIESGQWALGNIPFGALMWLAMIGAMIVLVRRFVRQRRSDPRTTGGRPAELAAVILPWLLVPMLALIAESAVATPLYSARYLTFSAPAAAALTAVAVTMLHRRRTIAIALGLLLVVTLPTWVIQRTPNAKQDSTWGQVAAVIASERAAEPSGQLDAVVYGPLRRHPEADMGMLAIAYPQQFAGLIDLKLDQTGAERGTLWDSRIPLAATRDRLDGARVIWLVTSDMRDWRPGVGEQTTEWGYRLDEQWHFDGINLVRYVRN